VLRTEFVESKEIRYLNNIISLSQKPTGCTIYVQFISIINLYVFRAGVLLIIRRYYTVYT